MDTDVFKGNLIEFIQGICNAHDPGIKIAADTALFENRLINSIRIIEIMSYVERELQISIPEDMLSMEFFKTPEMIAQLFAKA